MVAEADCNGALCDRPLATLYTQFSQSYKNAPFRDRLLGSAVCWPPNVRNGWHQPFLRFCVFRCPYRGIRPVDMSTHVQQQPQTLRIATPLGTCPSQSLTRSEQLPTIRRLEEPQATSLHSSCFFFRCLTKTPPHAVGLSTILQAKKRREVCMKNVRCF